MSVRMMTLVYAAHFHDVTFIHQGKKKETGEQYEKTIKVLNSNLKSVCLALADHANDEGEGSYPSVDTLSEKTELSSVTVIACLKAMRQESIITYAGRSKWNTGNYTVIKPKLIEMATWERQRRPKKESKAALVSESKAASLGKVKPLKRNGKAALVKPSSTLQPSLINKTPLEHFTGYFGKFNSMNEIERWQILYEIIGKDQAEALLSWAFKKEIHMMNRAGLLDSLETAAKNWKVKPVAKSYGKQPSSMKSSFDLIDRVLGVSHG
jgi:hypothetical protein